MCIHTNDVAVENVRRRSPPLYMALLGVDVGYSATRPTTGLAWLAGGEVGTAKTHADLHRRLACLPSGVRYAVIAIDGPLLPDHAALDARRACEHIFVRDVFQKRCKPGMSHFGAGLELRRAAKQTRQHFESFADPDYGLFRGPYVAPALPIVEAFPNAFLGVLLSDGCFALSKPGKRKRFDWLYERAVEQEVLDRLLEYLDWPHPHLQCRIAGESDHDKRAALVCLLTAMCAALGEATPVGDTDAGYFWLPPRELWAKWAREAYSRSHARQCV